MANREMTFLQPLFGGFFRIAPFAQTDDDGRVLGMVADGRRSFLGMAADDGGQPPKGGWIIVAPGWLAYLGLVVNEGIYRRRAVV